jgi:hypothetical protein
MVNPFKSGGSFKNPVSTGVSQRSAGNTASASQGTSSLGSSASKSGARPTAQVVPQSVGASAASAMTQAASSFSNTISSAFANASVTSQDSKASSGGVTDSVPPLKQDQTQREIIEEQLARKKAAEEARIHREKELEWERNMEAEKQRRLQQASSRSNDNQVHSLAAALPSPRSEGIGASGSPYHLFVLGSLDRPGLLCCIPEGNRISLIRMPISRMREGNQLESSILFIAFNLFGRC